jgi:hypothetical protein
MLFISLSHDVIYMWSWALYLGELVDDVLHILCYSSALLLYLQRHLYHDV